MQEHQILMYWMAKKTHFELYNLRKTFLLKQKHWRCNLGAFLWMFFPKWKNHCGSFVVLQCLNWVALVNDGHTVRFKVLRVWTAWHLIRFCFCPERNLLYFQCKDRLAGLLWRIKQSKGQMITFTTLLVHIILTEKSYVISVSGLRVTSWFIELRICNKSRCNGAPTIKSLFGSLQSALPVIYLAPHWFLKCNSCEWN